jgi:hypothetical protein
MPQIKDFKIGDKVCTVGYNHLGDNIDESDWEYESKKESLDDQKQTTFYGIPSEIVHIEYPFVVVRVVSNPYEVCSLDIRKHELQEMSDAYWELWKAMFATKWATFESNPNRG